MPLVEGTKITLKDKTTKAVQDLKIDDELITYEIHGLRNIQNMEILEKQDLSEFNGSFRESKIKNIWLDISDDIYKINDTLVSDGSHYVFIKRNDSYSWKRIFNIEIGDSLFTIDNQWTKIVTIEKIDEKKETYNVQMNSIYNYFANGYLVHNGDPCTACGSACSGDSS